jgi:hypothetical protein
MENFHVGILMNILRGLNRGSIITGKSIHNQRIERLWRDVFKEVASTFYAEFYSLEDADVLHPDDPLHRCALHITYLPCINKRLAQFQEGWNNHKLRTERNKTPEQLWLSGMLHNFHSTAPDGVFSDDVTPTGDHVIQLCQQRNAQLVRDVVNTPNSSMTGWQSELNLLPSQFQEIQASMSSTADNKTRYLQCLAKLSEILA